MFKKIKRRYLQGGEIIMTRNKTKENIVISGAITAILSTILTLSPAAAQSGGSYVIEKSVISGGGGQVAGGGFTLDGASGQPIAGTRSSAGTFELGSGFWGSGTSPSANATVSGRVLTSDGRGLRNATMSITDSNGVSRVTTTSSFGFFSFDNVSKGGIYIFRVSSRLFRFAPRTVQIDGNLTLADFVGLE